MCLKHFYIFKRIKWNQGPNFIRHAWGHTWQNVLSLKLKILKLPFTTHWTQIEYQNLLKSRILLTSNMVYHMHQHTHIMKDFHIRMYNGYIWTYLREPHTQIEIFFQIDVFYLLECNVPVLTSIQFNFLKKQ